MHESSSDRIEGLAMTAGTNKLIRNSSAELLTFTGCAGNRSIEARYDDDIARSRKEWERK